MAFMGATSCNDYLDVDAPSKYTEDFIFTDVEEANILLNGVYQSVCSDNTYGNAFVNTFLLNSDVEWSTSSNEVQVASHSEFKAFDCEADASALEKTWAQAYTTIERANDFIAGAEKSPILTDMSNLNKENRASLLQMIGEAKCLRAMNYFDLSILMGDIPFSFERSIDHPNNLIIPITDRDVIQTNLINDLIAAAKNMKLSSEISSVERCTKEFAWALTARIAMFRAGYSLRHTEDPSYIGDMKRPADYMDYYKIARDYCDSVIIAGTHSLKKDWYQVFIDECKYISSVGDDPIFEIPFSLNTSGQVGYIHGPSYSKTVYDTWGKSSGNVRLNAFHRFTYDSQDARRDAIGYWSYSEGNVSILNSQTNFCNKWSKLWDPNYRMDKNMEGGTGINFPYMRYADVLLMYAEAINEISGPNGVGQSGVSAKDALKMVRDRAFRKASDKAEKVDTYVDAAGASQDVFLKAIQDERAWEFAGEGLRWKDLVRWNIYNKVIFKSFWQFIGMAESDNSYDPNYSNYPTTAYYKVIDPKDKETDEAWDTNFPNQTLPQIKFYNNVGTYGFDNKWQNWTYILVNFGQEAFDSELKNCPTSGTDAWSTVNWFSWFDDNNSVAAAACRLSVRGYIYKDIAGTLHPAGMPEYDYTDESTLENLPTLRYIMPIPQDAITRSSGAYKNYYGY